MVKESLKPPQSYCLLTAEMSRRIDRHTTQQTSIDSFTLMEIAGSSAAKIFMQEWPNLSHGIYLCGKGNNGGDALVFARYLHQNNLDATLLFISGTDNLSPDAEANFELLKKFDAENSLTIFESWDEFNPPKNSDFIVDGMLGTGLTSDVRSDYVKAVEWANEQSDPVFAMDISTGLHSDSGQIMGCAVKATETFTFGGQKPGFYLNDGPSLTGKIHYCELPFPNQFKKKNCSTYLLDENWVPMEAPTPGRHKYDSGVLYIVAGSEGLTGAAMTAAKSAWAEGLGAVILICTRGQLPIYEQQLPSIIKKPIGGQGDFFYKPKHTDDVLDIIRERKGKLLIGPGLGRDDATVQFVDQLLSANTADVVIDADGLWCLSQLSEWPKSEQSNWILTPHPGELSRLITNSMSSAHQRLQAVVNVACTQNVTILSKGMPGLIGTPSGNCYVTNYDTHYFSRAGSGDVLAGKVSARLALGHTPDVSCAASLLQGKQKLDYFLQNFSGIPEPTYFI